MEVLAEAAGVIVEDGLGVPETLQNGKDLHGLEERGRESKTARSGGPKGSFEQTFI